MDSFFRKSKAVADQGFASYGPSRPRKSENGNEKSKTLSRGNSANSNDSSNSKSKNSK